MYLEATGPNVNEHASLISPEYIKDSGAACNLSFFYHMYGDHIGTLNVYLMTSSGDTDLGNLTWFRQGEQEKTWLEGKVNITDIGGTFQVNLC